jgi:hypothetical protein
MLEDKQYLVKILRGTFRTKLQRTNIFRPCVLAKNYDTSLPNCGSLERVNVVIMPSCIAQKERQFIRDLADRNERKLNQKYTPNYKGVLKYRILQKRKTSTSLIE